MARKKILCLDFDGVIHSYTSGWQGHDTVSDAPVVGSLEFIRGVLPYFRVQIFSSRSLNDSGILAMKRWVEHHALEMEKAASVPFGGFGGKEWWLEIEYPTHKPAAFLTIDDRAITFNGRWPSMDEMVNFRTWWELASAGALRETGV